MINIQSGLDKTRLVSNIIMLLLLAGNIFFSIQYTQNARLETERQAKVSEEGTLRLQTARFLKSFIDVVLNTKSTISFEDRVKLENDVRQIKNPVITKEWDAFVASATPLEAQEHAVKLMSLLSSTLI